MAELYRKWSTQKKDLLSFLVGFNEWKCVRAGLCVCVDKLSTLIYLHNLFTLL